MLMLPLISFNQKKVKVQISYQTSTINQNTVQIDSLIVESGFGQGVALKIHLLLFDNNCELVDTLNLGEYNPFNQNFKAYHYRQIESSDMIQLDSTLKFRIPNGYHYFLYTPCQYRKDFVQNAYAPVLTTLDSLWGNQIFNASTAIIAYGNTGNANSYEGIVVNPDYVITSMTKKICYPTGVEENIDIYNYKIFPNPAKSKVNIEFNTTNTHIVQLLDISGKIVSEIISQSPTITLDLFMFQTGFYMLNILNDNQIYTESLIIE
jgi:hypothetical protein